VARDGIEPPTPAFSGLDSFRAIMLITKAEIRLNAPKTAHLLGQEWDKILAGQDCLSLAVPIPFSEPRYIAVPGGWQHAIWLFKKRKSERPPQAKPKKPVMPN